MTDHDTVMVVIGFVLGVVFMCGLLFAKMLEQVDD